MKSGFRHIKNKIKDYKEYKNDLEKYTKDKNDYIGKWKSSQDNRFSLQPKEEYPILDDYRKNAGNIDEHYFYMDIAMAREIIKNKPSKHYDIGSRIDGFIAHLLAADIDVTEIDIRPLEKINMGIGIKSLNFIQSDATNLENIEDNSIESLSALHSVEHFGLGRYGDTVDPQACFKAMKAMQKVLAVGGTLYFAVPVGKEEKLCFNAHRIFAPTTVIKEFSELTLEKMWLLHEGKFTCVQKGELKNIENIGEYDCGLFIFKKKG